MLSTVTTSERIAGIVIGRLVDVADSAQIRIDYPGNPLRQPLSATSAVAVTAQDVGREIALAFDRGDPERPIILGFIYQPQRPAEPEQSGVSADGGTSLEVRLDGERVTLSADKEIVLRCGKASLTLTRAGKVLIRGAYLLSRSSGVNRIKGGSVQIN